MLQFARYSNRYWIHHDEHCRRLGNAVAVQKNLKYENYVCVNSSCPYNAEQIEKESDFLNLDDTYFPFWYGVGIGFVF